MRTTSLAEARAFFGELEADNSVEFWARERRRYDGVRSAFLELLEAISLDWRVYRPQNNRRFQRDLPPYKTFLGAVREEDDGVGLFLRLDARGKLLGTGIPMPAADQLVKLRSAIADEVSGSELEAVIGSARRSGAVVRGGRWDPLIRMPRGFDADRPRADLLRWKGIEADVRTGELGWPTISDAALSVRADLARAEPLNQWLARYVGPSALTPQERFAPRPRSK